MKWPEEIDQQIALYLLSQLFMRFKPLKETPSPLFSSLIYFLIYFQIDTVCSSVTEWSIPDYSTAWWQSSLFIYFFVESNRKFQLDANIFRRALIWSVWRVQALECAKRALNRLENSRSAKRRTDGSHFVLKWKLFFDALNIFPIQVFL